MSLYAPPTAAGRRMDEARDLLAAYDAAPDGTGVLDGFGVELRKRGEHWYRTDRPHAYPMTTAQLFRQLCPDLADEIDEIEKETVS